MPTRITITFTPREPGQKELEFHCVSGDFDPGPELTVAYNQVRQALSSRGGWLMHGEDV